MNATEAIAAATWDISEAALVARNAARIAAIECVGACDLADDAVDAIRAGHPVRELLTAALAAANRTITAGRGTVEPVEIAERASLSVLEYANNPTHANGIDAIIQHSRTITTAAESAVAAADRAKAALVAAFAAYEKANQA
jgi:hypothetical protein